MVSFNLQKQPYEIGTMIIPIFQLKTFKLWLRNNLGSHC